MSFESKNLSALSYSNGFTLWHYRTSDQFDDLTTDKYFVAALKMLRPGDFILVNANNAHGMLVVPSNLYSQNVMPCFYQSALSGKVTI